MIIQSLCDVDVTLVNPDSNMTFLEQVREYSASFLFCRDVNAGTFADSNISISCFSPGNALARII